MALGRAAHTTDSWQEKGYVSYYDLLRVFGVSNLPDRLHPVSATRFLPSLHVGKCKQTFGAGKGGG